MLLFVLLVYLLDACVLIMNVIIMQEMIYIVIVGARGKKGCGVRFFFVAVCVVFLCISLQSTRKKEVEKDG